MKKKDQDAIARLYTEGYDEYSGHNDPEMDDGSYDEDDDHSYQDTWGADLINSEEYQSVATIVGECRKLDDRLLWESILTINTGDKNKILTALDELGVNPRFKSNIGGGVYRDED